MKTYNTLLQELVNAQDAEALFEMANLVPQDTGLPFVVWISPRGNARHDVRVKVSKNAKAIPSQMVSVTIRPTVEVVEGSMKASDLSLLKKWLELNHDLILKYWDGTIESTKTVVNAIQHI